MPAFDTSEPISVTAEVEAGSIQLVAADRDTTVVDVQPRRPKKDADVQAAERTEVTYTGGRLHIRTPRRRMPLGHAGVVDVTVALPPGSGVEVAGAWAEVRGSGLLGGVRVKTSSGDIRLDATGPLQVNASHGSVTVERVTGSAEISTGSGSVRVGVLDGTSVLKNTHGTTTVGQALGDLSINGATGDIIVERVAGSLTATTVHGTVRVTEVARGSVRLETSHGAVDVGIRAGTAAELDVSSGFGRVHNALEATGARDPSEGTAKIRARTRYGNIDIGRTAPRA